MELNIKQLDLADWGKVSQMTWEGTEYHDSQSTLIPVINCVYIVEIDLHLDASDHATAVRTRDQYIMAPWASSRAGRHKLDSTENVIAAVLIRGGDWPRLPLNELQELVSIFLVD